MVGDGTMLHLHTLTQGTSCRCLRFGADMIIASVLLLFSRRLWSDIHSLASSMHRQFLHPALHSGQRIVGRHLHKDGIEVDTF